MILERCRIAISIAMPRRLLIPWYDNCNFRIRPHYLGHEAVADRLSYLFGLRYYHTLKTLNNPTSAILQLSFYTLIMLQLHPEYSS